MIYIPQLRHIRSIAIIFATLFIGALLNYTKIKAAEEMEDAETVEYGNFSLPESQQPGPLVGFGEHVIGKGKMQLSLMANVYIGNNNHKIDLIPSFLYGPTKRFSVRFSLPYALENKYNDHNSSGIEDVFVDLEYAFYSRSCKYWVDQSTLYGSISFPTGSDAKNPSTGYGSTSWTFGVTYNHTAVDWFYFGATGAVLTRPNGANRVGNQFLYQAGIGRDICTPPGWIYAWMIEFIGQYSRQNISDNHKNLNSGGNLISIIPSLWLSSETLIFQLGIGTPVVQNLFGDQRKQYLSVFFNFARTW